MEHKFTQFQSIIHKKEATLNHGTQIYTITIYIPQEGSNYGCERAARIGLRREYERESEAQRRQFTASVGVLALGHR